MLINGILEQALFLHGSTSLPNRGLAKYLLRMLCWHAHGIKPMLIL